MAKMLIGAAGSGGSGTVNTDGVTIQGNGSVATPIALLDAITDGVTLQGAGISSSKLALKAVQTNSGLTGTGAVGSPLGLTPSNFYSIGSFGGGPTQAVTANTLVICGVVIPLAVVFSNFTFWLAAGDASHDSDIGIYTPAGALLANLGAQLLTGTGAPQTIATLQSGVVIQPGKYLVAWTSAASTLSLYTDAQTNAPWCWFSSASYGTSVGGACPASITAPAQSIARGGPLPWLGLS